MFPKIKSRPKSNVGSQQCSILNKIGKGINSKEKNEFFSLLSYVRYTIMKQVSIILIHLPQSYAKRNNGIKEIPITIIYGDNFIIFLSNKKSIKEIQNNII